MNDYITGRQLAIQDISKEELNKLIQKMLEIFGNGWIDQEKNHIIHRLWKRQDYLATNELLNLANAIDKVNKVNPKWLQGQIKKVKSKDINNIKGALFEILGFSYLINDAYKLELAADGNPGIDGTICFNKNIKINISMKNFGISRFETDFNKDMDDIKVYLTKLIEKAKVLTLQCIICFKKYPCHSDFNIVKKNIKNGVDEFTKGKELIISDGIADIKFGYMRNQRFAQGTHSYILLAISPLHNNEFKNLTDKLESACDNLIKQKKVETSNEINGVIVHLHENAAIKRCQELMQGYLDENPDKPISFINLYSSCVARDLKTNTSQIVHTIMPAFNPIRYENWIKQNRIHIPSFTFFVGSTSLEESPRKLFINGLEGETLEDKYFYQCGEIYEDAYKLPNGTIHGDTISKAPGIIVNSVIEMQGKRMIIKGKFPAHEHLEIM